MPVGNQREVKDVQQGDAESFRGQCCIWGMETGGFTALQLAFNSLAIGLFETVSHFSRLHMHELMQACNALQGKLPQLAHQKLYFHRGRHHFGDSAGADATDGGHSKQLTVGDVADRDTSPRRLPRHDGRRVGRWTRESRFVHGSQGATRRAEGNRAVCW